MKPQELTLVIAAGGKSSRMGKDKRFWSSTERRCSNA